MENFDSIRRDQQEENQHLYLTMELVGNIMAERSKQDMSQRELSSLTGIAQKTISRIENGIDIPGLDTICKMADALNLQINFSVTPKGNKKEVE